MISITEGGFQFVQIILQKVIYWFNRMHKAETVKSVMNNSTSTTDARGRSKRKWWNFVNTNLTPTTTNTTILSSK